MLATGSSSAVVPRRSVRNWGTASERKAADAFASKLADGVFEGGTVTMVSLAGLATLLGLQELLNLLTTDCDGTVAIGTFEFTAAQLAGMVANANQTWDETQDNPGSNSPAGCGANSDYQVHYRVETVLSTTFQGSGGPEGASCVRAAIAPASTCPTVPEQLAGSRWTGRLGPGTRR
ncbi:MAG: hypothetical protein ABSB76_04915 [Streptosporangiaceae bacterium]